MYKNESQFRKKCCKNFSVTQNARFISLETNVWQYNHGRRKCFWRLGIALHRWLCFCKTLSILYLLSDFFMSRSGFFGEDRSATLGSRRFDACDSWTQTFVAGSAERQSLLIAVSVSHVVSYRVKRSVSEEKALLPTKRIFVTLYNTGHFLCGVERAGSQSGNWPPKILKNNG